MHEVSLAGGVLKLVEDTALRERFSRLLSLRLEAGQLAGVDARALRFALECLAPGTVLEGAQIDIEEPPGQAWCLGCTQTVAIAQRGDACPACGSYQLQPTGGMALRVLDMQVSDD
ncbi:MAG: hydrogenase maturation nickel metallochaperone HypA [Hydrogenophaga sp.]|uniref:hydrogenase maturation nickel metallochaperone HypA/HybF n=1 Tax=Hydrogenophaga sp. TaxID=1904254 RepID=UPI001BBCCCE5|nr:hydrogenase maturation nickel metallochaperone HypA [Hydrogenophaga sp.]MBS3910336.1 hydrogenase maturation nickel metallochaperone HypA [Hydrogenophaga sp.]MDO9146553.1 hydrogenase maturation nickel metallochaperone HypA [Hydrogenophaga sp.]MDO9604990.1 hydrogenase maturation nickel metallochaperone HypA [Hydrogenophaga sp.]